MGFRGEDLADSISPLSICYFGRVLKLVRMIAGRQICHSLTLRPPIDY